MKACTMIIHKGKTIVMVDVAGATSEETIQTMQDAQKKITAQPPKSVLLLTDVTDVAYNRDNADALKAYASHITPYVKASAIVGADGVRSVILQVVATLTGRDIKAFKDREEALDWLVEQGRHK
jgi:2-polyprenyl-6-methoxyphenol hydroxylase-like FAD-dependent oxidoreductase